MKQAGIVLLLAGILIVYSYRTQLFGKQGDVPVRIATVVALVVLGWWLARDIGQVAGPTFFRRMDPSTAGTVGFLIRLLTIAVTLLVALRIAGVHPATLVAGSAWLALYDARARRGPHHDPQ